jgi:prepilin-type N-terminal cleavage/methylation domain-containing protein
MAEDLMRNKKVPGALAGQAGFSMVEMLMTAFILAIGLLGLCMLQTMSLRAGRGSRSLATAVHVATALLDQVEMEGRLSWLNLNNTNFKGQTNANLTLTYIPLAVGTSTPVQNYNIQGNLVDPTSTDPTVNSNFFQVTAKHVDDVGNAVGLGQVSDYTVTVQFSDTVNASQTKVQRSVVLTRRITHG